MRLLGGLAALLVIIAIAVTAMPQNRKEPKLISHLTLYVGEPLLSRGGTVIVGAIPIPVEEWQALDGTNVAEADESNQKRATLGDDDQLFGAFVYGPVTYVELYYPENGTFGFNFVPDYRTQKEMSLTTEQLLVGSGNWYDRKREEQREWSDALTIYVDGPSANRANSRLVRAYSNNLLNLTTRRQEFAGAIVYTPSNAEILEGTFGEYK